VLHRQKSELEEMIKGMKRELHLKQQTIEELMNASLPPVASLEPQLLAAQAKLREMQSEVMELRQELEQSRRENEERQHSKTLIEEDLTRIQNKVRKLADAQRDRDKAVYESETLNAVNVKLRSRIKQLQGAVKTAREKLEGCGMKLKLPQSHN
jgi:chromosome segregation ATPase